jgi:hypothetical protein
MPLISCPECAYQISSLAPACPRCGRPSEGGATNADSTGPNFPQSPMLSLPGTSQPRTLRVADVALFIAAFIAFWNFAPKQILLPVSSITGLALAYFGVAMFFPMRRWLYQHDRSAIRVEILSVGIAFALALLSLIIWKPLFTVRDYIFFPRLEESHVWLWFMLTWLFGYLFFVSRKVFALAVTSQSDLPMYNEAAPSSSTTADSDRLTNVEEKTRSIKK